MGRSTRGCRAPKHKRNPNSSLKIPGTPTTQDSDCPSTPWGYNSTESLYQEDDLVFLEDKCAYHIIWLVCQFFWHMFLFPVWERLLRPTVWDMALKPVLLTLGKIPWDEIFFHTLWETIIVQGLWEGLQSLLLWAVSLPQPYVKRPISALQSIWKGICLPIVILICIKCFKFSRASYRALEPVRRYIMRPIVHPILRALIGAHRLALYFCTWLSFSICSASHSAYTRERGYVTTAQYSEATITEFPVIPHQLPYTVRGFLFELLFGNWWRW